MYTEVTIQNMIIVSISKNYSPIFNVPFMGELLKTVVHSIA